MTKAAKRGKKRSRGGRPTAEEIEGREARLLQIAGQTFLKFGFDGTTMDAIAAAAHMSKRTLYACYPDKGALFNAVLRDLINRWLIPIDQIRTGQGELRGRLLDLARYLTTFALTPQSVSVHRVIVSEVQRRPDFGRLANEAGRKPALQAIISILEQHRTELRPVDLEMAAEQFLSLAVDSCLRLASLGLTISTDDTERWVRSSVDLFLAGVKRRPSTNL